MGAYFEMAIDLCVIFDLELSKGSEKGARFCHLWTDDCRSTMATLFKCLAITIGIKNPCGDEANEMISDYSTSFQAFSLLLQLPYYVEAPQQDTS